MLTETLGHADRAEPLRAYTTGLLLPGDRKSVEPMAARLDPRKVRSKHQSMRHFVAVAPRSDERVLARVREFALPALRAHGPIEAWLLAAPGLPKKGIHSVGVARQDCGQLGKTENCQVAVSLSIANEFASLPIAYQLYLPGEWAEGRERCSKAGVPEGVTFRTKPQIALAQIRAALAAGVPGGVVVADAGYGNGAEFRDELRERGLRYAVGVLSTTRVWAEGRRPLPPQEGAGNGRPPTRLRRDPEHQPVTAKEFALENKARFRWVGGREGTKGQLRGRFLAARVRSAHRDYQRREARDEEWVVVEWPEGEPEPTKYFSRPCPSTPPLRQLVRRVKIRWRIERDYEELKQELGLTHYEGRGWRGFHHHAPLTIAAYAFLVAERGRVSPSGAGGGTPQRQAARVPRGCRPRGSPDPPRAACADLDRHAAHPPQRGAGTAAAPLSVLSASQRPRGHPKEDL